MATILIIGSSGMLGSAVTKYLSKSNHTIIELNTSGRSTITENACIKFDIEKQDIVNLLRFELGKPDYLVNCSGLIKHKIDETNEVSVKKAFKINADFPKSLSNFYDLTDAKIIQIATDCVYAGDSGNYCEDSMHDAIDVYGLSKSKGEIIARNVMNLRCSIIGKELNSHLSLIDWILGHSIGSKLKGYTNHFWNGITTYHFARIILGIIETDSFKSGTHHVLPSDSVSKFELIKMVCESFERKDLVIEAFETEITIDRRIGTKHPEINSEFWRSAGYDKPLSIREMIAEYSNWIRAE
jgi:dTDP-4-dehydrorhamnose reductase